MKAAIRYEYGTPDVITVTEIGKPLPGKNDLQIAVHFTTVNRTDISILSGLPHVFRLFIGVGKPKRPILGTDFSGIVTEIGEDVTNFKVGDRVWGLNDEGLSSQAEFMCISSKGNVVKVPENINLDAIAACGEGPHYAINFLNKLKLQSGQAALVNGATGGIGTALVQMLKNKGLDVTAVGETKNVALMRDLGADLVVDYKKENFLERNEKYHYIFDTVGNVTFQQCKPILLRKGIYLSSELGPRSQNIFLGIFSFLFFGKKVVFPLPSKPKKSLANMNALLESNQYTPVIDRTYSIDQIRDAYTYVKKGFKTGNVLISLR